MWGAVLNAGLEPFAGFLHVDRPGKILVQPICEKDLKSAKVVENEREAGKATAGGQP